MSELELRELIMDAAGCATPDEFYDRFFGAVGAPNWHGRNFNSLRDSIRRGQINRIEVPYRLVIANYDRIDPAAKKIADDFIDLIGELGKGGVPVEVRVEISK